MIDKLTKLQHEARAASDDAWQKCQAYQRRQMATEAAYQRGFHDGINFFLAKLYSILTSR